MADEPEDLEDLRAENERLKAELEARDAAAQASFSSPPPPPSSPIVSGGSVPLSPAAAAAWGCARWAWGLVALVLVLMVGTCALLISTAKPVPATPPPAAARSPAPAPAPVPAPAAPTADAPAQPSGAPAASQWIYDDTPGEMSSAAVKMACVTSSDTVDMGFPYGVQHLELCLRRRHGLFLNVMVSPERGAGLRCSSDRCFARLRFDDGWARRWPGSPPAGGGSNVVFLGHETWLIHKIKGAKRLRVQLEFKQTGRQSAAFSVGGLQW